MTPPPENTGISSGTPPRALVVTALPVEYNAARAHLSELHEFVTPLGMVGEVGTFRAGALRWRVGIVQVGMGNERAAVETERAVAALDPQVVVFVGVAGGLKDVNLGDVLVASKIYAYEYGKDAGHFRPRPEALEPSYRILSRASVIARNEQWRMRVRLPQDTRVLRQLTAVVKPLAAGSRVVSDTRSASATLLREHFSDAAAVEMEGHGFLRTLQAHPGREALIVRGISDLVDGKEASDAQNWQAVASATAAAFAFEVLAQYGGTGGERSSVAVVGPREADFWRTLRSVLVRLYPGGPQDERVWQRAGGDPSRLPSGASGRTTWFDAISMIERGGGGATVASLLREVGKDYPQDPEVVRLVDRP